MKKLKAGAGKGKAKVEAKMEEHRQAEMARWRTGVMKNPEAFDVDWAPLTEWTKHEDATNPQQKSKVRHDAEEKARRSLLNKVHKSISNRMMFLLTEIASVILQGTEDPVRAADANMGILVDQLTAIVNTYHLGFNTKKRWPYLRRFANDKLVDVLVTMLGSSDNSAKEMQKIKDQVSKVIISKKAEAADMVQANINKMMEADVDVPIPEGVPGQADDAAVALQSTIDGMIQTLGGAISSAALGKVDSTTDVMVQVLNDFLDSVLVIYEEAQKAGVGADGKLTPEALEGMKEEVFAQVGVNYDNAFAQVSAQVGGFVHFLDMMMHDEDEASMD